MQKNQGLFGVFVFNEHQRKPRHRQTG